MWLVSIISGFKRSSDVQIIFYCLHDQFLKIQRINQMKVCFIYFVRFSVSIRPFLLIPRGIFYYYLQCDAYLPLYQLFVFCVEKY